MMHLPSIVIVSFYFSHHRALATSLVLCGSGIGKFLFAPLSRYLIDRYGWRGANFIVAGLVLQAAICGSVFRPAAAVVVDRQSASRHRRRPTPGCAVMETVIAEKRRRRLDSTGSLDDTTITSEGRLLRPHPVTATPPSASDPLQNCHFHTTVGTPRTSLIGVSRSSDTHSTSFGAVRPRTRTVSDPTDSSRVTTNLSIGSVHVSATDRSSSSESELSGDVQRTSSDHAAIDIDDGQSSEQSSATSTTPPAASDPLQNRHFHTTFDTLRTSSVGVPSQQLHGSDAHLSSSSAIWVAEHGDVERSDSVACSEVIEMTDVTHSHEPSSSIARTYVTSSASPSVLRPLSSRPDLFYTGSNGLQVCSDFLTKVTSSHLH